MPQRKDTPAARAALARRRQRAAQTLRNSPPNAPLTSATGTLDQVGVATSKESVTTTAATATAKANRPQQIKSQIASTTGTSTTNDTFDIAARTVAGDAGLSAATNSMNRQTDATAITTNSTIGNEPREASNSLEFIMERRGVIPDQLPSLFNVSLSKSQSFGNRSSATPPSPERQRRNLRSNYNVTTGTGISSTPSTGGESNIETVLQGATPASHPSASSASAKTRIVQKQRNKEKERPKEVSKQQDKRYRNRSQEKFERISNFGYVERTSPQPMVPDRRDITPTPSGSHLDKNNANSRSGAVASGEMQFPFPGASKPAQTSLTVDSTTDRAKKVIPRTETNPDSIELKSKKQISAVSKTQGRQQKKPLTAPQQFSNRKDGAKSSQYRNPKSDIGTKTKPVRNSEATTKTTKLQIKKSVDEKRGPQQPQKGVYRSSSFNRLLSSNSKTDGTAAGESLTRSPRMPSPTPKNSNVSRALPRRSSSPRRTTSPVKKLSPRRFRLPPNNTTGSPSKSSARSNSVSRTHESRSETSSRSNMFVKTFPNHVSRVEDLSEYLTDSFSVADASLILDGEQQHRDNSQDPVVQSRNLNGGETNAVQSSSYASSPYARGRPKNEIDDQLDRRIHSRSVIRQRISSQNDEIERYRASADENDAKYLNVRSTSTTDPDQKFGLKTPRKTAQKLRGSEATNREVSQSSRDWQVVDATSLHSGNYVMLRSCSMFTTLQGEGEGLLAEFSGPSLGKDEEVLQLIKVNDTRFSPLMYGDVVVLQSSTRNRNALGARRKRNDVNGRDEIGFFHDSNEESNWWMIHSATAGTNILIGRTAVTEKHPIRDSNVPVRSGNCILLVNCYNGGMLSIRDGVAVLLTDSYDPNRNASLLGRLESNNRIEPSASETFQLLQFSIPPCPTWITPKGLGERLFLTGSYLSQPLRNQNEDITVDVNLPLKAKENILVDEVVGSFLGLEGFYIKLKEKEEQSTNSDNVLTFELADDVGTAFDLSLRNLVEQILPLSTSYVSVRNFIGLHYPGYEYGRVMQAFCERLDLYLQQFVSFVAQLEHKIRKSPSAEGFTMKSIHFEITPLLHSMSVLEHTAKVVTNKKGGALINALRSLQKRVYMGDTVAKDLLGTLLDHASVPYAEMLSIWLQSGRLHDPYEEFMIKKTHNTKNKVELDGDTWAEFFTINEDHVINDIVRNEKFKTKILVTGKYWNAVQACIVDPMSSQETSARPLQLKKLQFQSDLSEISSYIVSMYESASEKLMHILRDKFHLKNSLEIMKRYFLLDQVDFLVNFLQATGEELAKPFEEVSIGRVQHFLGISVRFTESQREDIIDPETSSDVKIRSKLSPMSLRCRLSEHSLVSYLDSLYGGIEDQGPINTPSRQKYGSQKQGTAGFDFFEIDFSHVPFPISLIISPTSMESYKLLFRHLFFAKHVERRMVGVWSDHQVLKKLDSLRGLLGPTFLLRQRMLHCVQNLMNYMAFEVVESNWLEMLSLIDVPGDTMSNQKQQTVDDLLDIHDGFLQKTIDSCLLTNPVLIKSLIKLLNTCLLFTDQMKRFMDTTRIYDDQFNIAAEKRGAVQRNLNERVASQSIAKDKKKLRRSLLLVKEERDILQQRQTRRVGREICSESYKRMICRFEEVFSADLSAFMMQLNSHTSSGIVANLGIRLDWNGYVTKKMIRP